VGVYDLRPLLRQGELRVPPLGNWAAVAVDKLGATVLRGKQLFYDARDRRLSLDRYMSCASCHNDGGSDGRTWDFTNLGEGLRNTPSLRGRAGTDHGWLHWSNNFDEVQDFETQIRNLSGGNGLMSNAALFAGTREQPLGDAKGGLSADLDALAAYLASLDRVDASPHRAADGSLPPEAAEGKAIFAAQGCGGCHAGPGYTASGANTLFDVGTLKPSSGQRLGQPLTGIDIPSLRDVWATAPYLHDGSAATLADAVRAHSGVSLGETDLGKLSAFLRAIGSQEPAPAVPAAGGRGLRSAYYNNTGFQAPVALSRVEAVNFVWPGSPGPGVNDNNFSVRWTGRVVAPITGSYRFQSVSNDSFVFTLGNQALIDNPTPHATTTDTSAPIQLVAGQSYPVTIRFYDVAGGAVARLRWQVPTTPGFVQVPADRLFPN
jgi:cytochrome c553